MITTPKTHQLWEFVHARWALVLPAVILVCAGAIAGCGLGHSSGSKPAAAADATRLIRFGKQAGVQIDPASLKLAGVRTIVAGVQSLKATVEPTGQVTPLGSASAQITPRLPGKVVRVFVTVGSQVHKGQVIATVDSVDLAQAEAAYETALDHARLAAQQLEQQRKLAQYGVLNQPALEDAKKSLAAAQAAVSGDKAQVKLDEITLVSTKRLVDMGEITQKPVEDAENAYAQAQSALAQARANSRSANTSLARVKILYNGGIDSRQQLEDAQTSSDNAKAAQNQAAVQEQVAAQELKRQKDIFKQDLNGASSLQTAQSKLVQDQHTYENDLTGLSVARTQYARAVAVNKSGIPISQALQQAQDASEEAEASLRAAENTVRLYGVNPRSAASQLHSGHVVIPVLSPISGIVTARNMVVGQNTDTSTVLAKVVNLDKVYVDSQVYEKDIAGIRTGDPIQFRVGAYPTRVFTGYVQYIGNEVDPDTRTITVRTLVDNPGGMLRAGMFATVLIGSRKGVQALAIPADAVLQEDNRQIVYVQVAPNQFVKRTVKVGAAIDGNVPVQSGLSPGDRVVVSGNVLIENEQTSLENQQRGTS